ncbi:MAG: 50S ribosomal protein L28 [Ktedonobacterales bacterium]
MAARCEVCHRRPQYGHNVSHSNRKTNRRFKVNVQHRRIVINGHVQSTYICTRCLRTMVKVPKMSKPVSK